MTTTTTSAFLTVQDNLARYQAMTAAEPAVKTATEYYEANVGKVTSISDFVGNYRLLSYALNAYGLGDHINDKALITKVLEGGVSNSKSLANTLSDSRWKAFATAFNFAADGASSVSTTDAVETTTANYVEQQLETDQGQNNVGVQLALYFKRVAPTVTNEYGILADKNLLEVAETIFSLPSAASVSSIDAQAQELSKLMPLSDLADTKKLNQLLTRFTAMYDVDYGASSESGASLSVDSGNSDTTAPAASAILSSVISANGATIASALESFTSASSISTGLMTALAKLNLGG